MMYKSDCPTWLCNEWGVPHDIYYFLAFLLVFLPYAMVWRTLFKKNQHLFSTASSYWGLILLTEITSLVYLSILTSLSKPLGGHFILAVCYGPIIVIAFLLLPTIGITILVSIFSAARKETEIETDRDDDGLNT